MPSLEQYRIQTDPDTSADSGLERDILKGMGRVERAGEPAGVRFARRVMKETGDGIDRLHEAVAKYQAGVVYPAGGLARSLALAARIAAADLGTRILHVGFGGFDTHAAQAGAHERLLQNFALSVKAFLEDLKRQGRHQDTLILTMSEFGRRPAAPPAGA